MSFSPYQGKVVYEYKAVETTELTVAPGEIVNVKEVNDSGWGLVEIVSDTNRSGWVPIDYIEKADTAAVQTETKSVSTESSSSSSTPLVSAPSVSSDVVDQAAPLLQALTVTEKEVKLCAGCGKELTKAFVVAKEKKFHAECFVCTQCKTSLGGKAYIEKDEKFYCEDDYYSLFNPRCAHCNEVIKGPYINAMDKTWHPDHFVCTNCSKSFNGIQFLKNNDKPYCEECFQKLFSEKCARCGQPILGPVFEAVEKKYHLDCFVCDQGGHKIGEGQSFHCYENKIYCPQHFEELFAQKCSDCEKPITGQYIKVMDFCFHPNCWKCVKCRKQISTSDCVPKDKKFYCRACAASLSAPKTTAPSIPSSTTTTTTTTTSTNKSATTATPSTVTTTPTPTITTSKPTVSVSSASTSSPSSSSSLTSTLSTVSVSSSPSTSSPSSPSSTTASTVTTAATTTTTSSPTLTFPSVSLTANKAQTKEVKSSFVNPKTALEFSTTPAAKPSAASSQVQREPAKPPSELGSFTYNQLMSGDYPKSLDVTKREEYLADSEFKAVFGVDKAAFQKLAAWKQKQMKQKLNLF
eukprot:TRINITY_DN6113_c0_g1_i1.p1 TRINITY_DN6113_c0_g1~~TRINITY_DN6113_c0_g1_i1.p1  ORF type:complete len:577 (-),score=171.57 TRINITY_DN6113_c0_g1_i1:657-2387(-)